MSWRRRDVLTRMFLVGAAGLTLASVGGYWRGFEPFQALGALRRISKPASEWRQSEILCHPGAAYGTPEILM